MPKRIVILGCGPGGVTVANGLQDAATRGDVRVTILEKKDHVDLCTMVNGAFADEVLLTHDRCLLGATRPEVICVKDIAELREGEVRFIAATGEDATVPADAIVVATGTSYKGEFIKNDHGLHKQAWLQKLSTWREAAGKARHILVVGGGVTGVEVAGELATEHSACRVTLVHSRPYLCNEDKKFHDANVWGLESLPGKVDVLVDDSVQAEERLFSAPQTYITKQGKIIADVDMVVVCVLGRPNTHFIRQDLLDEKRQIVIDDTMQAKELTSASCPVFAVGDVTQCGWGRAMVADAMAKACVKNLLNFCAGKRLAKVYDVNKKPFLPVMVSLGRTQGAANVPFVNNFLGRWVKAPTVLASMIWPKMGVKDFALSSEAKGPSPLGADKAPAAANN